MDYAYECCVEICISAWWCANSKAIMDLRTHPDPASMLGCKRIMMKVDGLMDYAYEC